MPALNELNYRKTSRTVYTIEIDLSGVDNLHIVDATDEIEIVYLTLSGPTTPKRLTYREKRMLLNRDFD